MNMKLSKRDRNVFIKTFTIVLMLLSLSLVFNSCQTQELAPSARIVN